MPTLEEYQELLEGRTYGDDQNLGVFPIDHYDHDDGWEVDGFEKRQWLFVRQRTRTGPYSLSLDKLGLARPVPVELR